MAKPKGKRGQIGEQIFEQVRKLVAAEKISVTKAFEVLAQKSGGNKGTIAANYYRVAKKKGVKLRARGGTAAASPKASGAMAKAQAVLKELAAVIRAQENEIAKLRAENSRYSQIRKLISKA